MLVAVLPGPLLPATLPAPPLGGRLLLREEGPEAGGGAALVGVTLRPTCIRGSGDTGSLQR